MGRTGKQMQEMRQAMAHLNVLGHADAGKLVALELGDVKRGEIGSLVQSEIDQRAHAVYSTVSMPWLNFAAACGRSISASGIGSPVSHMARVFFITSRSSAQCS